ncbi:MAG: exonuclease domain-containing protein [Lachnospiraceae bacterium]|nr:exonuclease domain-containing protein [Lachnospiraceae bacterium]
MQYIVIDLEWNQSMEAGHSKKEAGPAGSPLYKIPPCEIIEIGAVKLNENFEIIGEFNELVRPRLYKQLHFATRKVTHIKQSELEQARGFSKVAAAFLKWVGNEKHVFCTWGSMDLTEFQRNLDYYHIRSPFQNPLLFYDLQRIYCLQYENAIHTRSLESAVDALGIPKDIPFHRASADTYYTALVMRKLDMERYHNELTPDLHRVPRRHSEEYLLNYDDYNLYVSRAFPDAIALMLDLSIRQTPCPVCGAKAVKKIKWFSSNHDFFCMAVCKKHGLLKAKIHVKHADAGGIFGVRKVELSDEESLEQMKERKLALAEKRRKKIRAEKEAAQAEAEAVKEPVKEKPVKEKPIKEKPVKENKKEPAKDPLRKGKKISKKRKA